MIPKAALHPKPRREASSSERGLEGEVPPVNSQRVESLKHDATRRDRSRLWAEDGQPGRDRVRVDELIDRVRTTQRPGATVLFPAPFGPARTTMSGMWLTRVCPF